MQWPALELAINSQSVDDEPPPNCNGCATHDRHLTNNANIMEGHKISNHVAIGWQQIDNQIDNECTPH